MGVMDQAKHKAEEAKNKAEEFAEKAKDKAESFAQEHRSSDRGDEGKEQVKDTLGGNQ